MSDDPTPPQPDPPLETNAQPAAVAETEAAEPKKMLGGITGKGFMPGVSGNPSGLPGRPKRKPITEGLVNALETELNPPAIIESNIRGTHFKIVCKTLAAVAAANVTLNILRTRSARDLEILREAVEGKLKAEVEIAADADIIGLLRDAAGRARNGHNGGGEAA